MTTWFGLRFSTVPWAVTSMGTCAPSAGPVMLIEGAGCAGLADAVLGAVAVAAKYVAAAGITAQSTGTIIFVRSPRFLGLVLGDPDDCVCRV